MNIPLDQQNIIAILGIGSLPDEQKLALVEKITNLVQKRLLVRIFDSLDETKQQGFSALIEAENQERVNAFLEQNTPKLGEWIMEEVTKIKQELKDLVAGLEI